MSITEMVHREMVRGLVMRHIVDPFGGGQILDVDTCVVVLDADGDPCTVMSPETYVALVRVAAENGVPPLGTPYTFDANTIPA